MDAAAEDDSVKLLLFGKMGNGKSATRKSIQCLDRNDEPLEERSGFNHRQIKIQGELSVDTKLNENEVQELHEKAATAMENGPFNAVLIVLKYGTRFTQGDKDILRFLKLTFGKDVVSEHGVVVLTNGDVFETDQDDAEEQGRGGITFEQWCSQQTGLFREIVEECKNRIVLFNNREKSQEKKVQQREELLKCLESIGNVEYTMEDFAKAEESRKLQVLEAQEPDIRNSVKQKITDFKSQLENIQGLEQKKQTESLGSLLSKVEFYAQSLKTRYTQLQDPEIRRQGEQVMRDCVQEVAMLEAQIRNKLELAKISSGSNRNVGNLVQDAQDKGKRNGTDNTAVQMAQVAFMWVVSVVMSVLKYCISLRIVSFVVLPFSIALLLCKKLKKVFCVWVIIPIEPHVFNLLNKFNLTRKIYSPLRHLVFWFSNQPIEDAQRGQLKRQY